MKQTLTLLIGILTLFGCKNEVKNNISASKKSISSIKNADLFGIVIHGGAGTILKENMSDSLENAYKEKLKEAILIGHTILKNGGTSIEAVTKTINVLRFPTL